MSAGSPVIDEIFSTNQTRVFYGSAFLSSCKEMMIFFFLHFSRRVCDCDKDEIYGSVTLWRDGWSAARGRRGVYGCAPGLRYLRPG